MIIQYRKWDDNKIGQSWHLCSISRDLDFYLEVWILCFQFALLHLKMFNELIGWSKQMKNNLWWLSVFEPMHFLVCGWQSDQDVFYFLTWLRITFSSSEIKSTCAPSAGPGCSCYMTQFIYVILTLLNQVWPWHSFTTKEHGHFVTSCITDAKFIRNKQQFLLLCFGLLHLNPWKFFRV